LPRTEVKDIGSSQAETLVEGWMVGTSPTMTRERVEGDPERARKPRS
jgi:hypothetical protein